ncbi:MAG: diacylglycerol kinase family protein [Clostridia bacterium]|nr:diacylglycerol kinase family protein [Clostridia bacterium]
MKHYILYNPLAGHDHKPENVDLLKRDIPGECVIIDVTAPGGYATKLSDLSPDDVITISGGDGTLNKFINTIDPDKIPCTVYYHASGSGNDFLNDVSDGSGERFIKLNPYLEHLPTVIVNGVSHRFINGIGFGLDGYACQKGDELKAKGKKVNYTIIAVKGLFFDFKPRNAKVTIDGKEYSFKKVVAAPTMNGRCYGGGMKATPYQDRLAGDGVSFMALHSVNKIKALIALSASFKGEHIKYTDALTIIKGREVEVEFDIPCALQIDGETIRDVKSYKVIY